MLEVRTEVSLCEYTDRKQKGIMWCPRIPSVQARPWHSFIQSCCQNTMRNLCKPQQYLLHALPAMTQWEYEPYISEKPLNWVNQEVPISAMGY